MVIPYHDFPEVEIRKCQYNDSYIQCHSYCKTDIGVHFQAFFEAVDGSDLNQIQLNEFGIITELEKSFRPLNIGKGVQCPSCNLKIKTRSFTRRRNSIIELLKDYKYCNNDDNNNDDVDEDDNEI